MDICDWRGIDDEIAALEGRIMKGEKVSPFSVMALSPSLAVQYAAAHTWSESEFPSNPVLGPVAPHPSGPKIRIGYFSMEFHYSAFAVMSTGVFEARDRAAFEIIAFSFGPNRQDIYRKRLEKIFDRFIDVSNQSDTEIAALARDLKTDIAVDLAGHQRNARPGIFSLRAALLQVQYQACPMGAADIDYFVTDAIFVPDHLRPVYQEKIARIPRLLPSDRSRPQPTRQFTRAELGLPEAGFVYCCFSAPYKITPQMFGAWMRILGQVPSSVLWLAARNPTAVANLQDTAQEHGIDPGRLVVASYMEAADHLARHSAADLFLDTRPFNANSTTADALWAGLPVITWAGEGVAGLGSANLLINIGLGELVTHSLAEYEALAVSLAREPERLAALKRRLAENRESGDIFDVHGYTRNLEKLYAAIFARQQQGLPPADIDII